MTFSILMVQCLQLGFAKLSILFFFRRIFCSVKKWGTMGVVTSILIVLVIAWSIAFFFVNLFECGVDFTLNWKSSAAQEFNCINEEKMNQGFMFSDFIMDVMIFILPMHAVCTHS